MLIKSVREPWYASRTASGGFQERFRVAGNEQADPARILTAELKRSLVQLDRTVRADEAGHRRMDISLDAGRVYIVLWNKKGLFGTRYQSVEELRAAAGEDVRWIRACMDAFLDAPALFPPAAPGGTDERAPTAEDGNT